MSTPIQRPPRVAPTTPAPFVEAGERPHAVRTAHLMMHLGAARPAAPWYRNTFCA